MKSELEELKLSPALTGVALQRPGMDFPVGGQAVELPQNFASVLRLAPVSISQKEVPMVISL